MAALIYTIIEAPDHGWGSTRTLVGFALAALAFAVFVVWERSSDALMLDLSLFQNPRFTAASASVAISFFALSGFIFLITQYFQFLKGYGPLDTGVRLLPVASTVAISSVLGTKLAVRFGTKLVVASGLLAMAAFYAWVTTASTTTTYGTIAVQMIVLGAGMGLTSAPATEAIMGVVPKAKAGVGSAVNDTTRLLGGTLGVAIIGSVYACRCTRAGLRHGYRPDCRAGCRAPRTHRSAQRSRSRMGCDRPGIPPWPAACTTPPRQRSSTVSARPICSPPVWPLSERSWPWHSCRLSHLPGPWRRETEPDWSRPRQPRCSTERVSDVT